MTHLSRLKDVEVEKPTLTVLLDPNASPSTPQGQPKHLVSLSPRDGEVYRLTCSMRAWEGLPGLYGVSGVAVSARHLEGLTVGISEVL